MANTQPRRKTRANRRASAPVPRFPSIDASSISRRLLCWYDRHRRDLPWRRRADDPYAQLLAEFMLQQTQVGTVLDYYDRFIERFPTVCALASAPLDDVLTLWSGLGYYSRARNLHAAARRIVEQHDGTVPATVEDLMSLPGIGRYTAGAIASIAYGVRAPVLDGNVTRVLMRLTATKADPKSPAVRERLWNQAERLLPRKRCGDFNQALMELGATLCSPRSPTCKTCPLSPRCQAHLHGLTGQIPPTARPARILPARMVVAAVGRQRGLLFVQRPASGLWGGLWELPSEVVVDDESLEVARKRLQTALPIRCRLSRSPVGNVTRQLTHRRITFVVFQGVTRDSHGQSRACCRQDSPHSQHQTPHSRPWRWVTPDQIPHLGISRACQAIIDALTSRRFDPAGVRPDESPG